MIEKLFNSRGLDETRICRAFKWIVTFRDFPEGSWQTVESEGMIKDAVTLFTKGRAEFFLEGVQRGDRVPGILSTEHELFPPGDTFKIVYVEPTTRVCIPRLANSGKLPVVEKLLLNRGDVMTTAAGGKYLVCLGSVAVNDKTFVAEKTFRTEESRQCTALENVMLLEFKDEATR